MYYTIAYNNTWDIGREKAMSILTNYTVATTSMYAWRESWENLL